MVGRDGLLDGGWFGFDVGEDGGDLEDLTAHLGLEMSDEVVGVRGARGFACFEVQLDVELMGGRGANCCRR